MRSKSVDVYDLFTLNKNLYYAYYVLVESKRRETLPHACNQVHT